ncbi:Sec-independent protein translocase protein TatB [Desulfonatronum thioautotrophicum]|uniref:Sec-independent protein translocase protein TatB n=1 Tax=Desulfonatronum thioautotrophicum TaxID=617001 RepID=UPI0009FD7A67|nr:Sec-independent protein translocase protein TatB [Desulfonatronum thioautotrophicum]
MFGIGTTELIIILLVALIVLGPTQLPGIARSLGKALGEFRRVTTDVQRTLNLEAAKIDEDEREKKKAAEAAKKAEAQPSPAADAPAAPQASSAKVPSPGASSTPSSEPPADLSSGNGEQDFPPPGAADADPYHAERRDAPAVEKQHQAMTTSGSLEDPRTTQEAPAATVKDDAAQAKQSGEEQSEPSTSSNTKASA